MTLLEHASVPDPLSMCLELMGHSIMHRYWTVADVLRLIVPPIKNGQILFGAVDDDVIGFCSWGLFSTEISLGFAQRSRTLTYDDWNSGNNLWIVDLIAPFGEGKAFALALRRRLYHLYPSYDVANAERNYGHGHKHKRKVNIRRSKSVQELYKNSNHLTLAAS